MAFAAAHVVPTATGENGRGGDAALDWEATLAFRRHLWSWQLGVAEAMDTAQRNMGLPWPTAAELIRRSAAEAHSCGGRIAAGAGTDQLSPEAVDLPGVLAAYEQQLEVVESAGAQPILMASRQLAAVARGADDYLAVYGRLIEQAVGPVVLHWLGPMFDPALEGYWGSRDLDVAADTVLTLVNDHADHIDGIKVSLLDADREVSLRKALPPGVTLYTGDDFNYVDLIGGDGDSHSDALLGVFAAIAPAASAALQALDRGDRAGYERVLRPTEPLARHLFSPPTYFYKTGIAFLAWLSGHQPGFVMVDGLQSARSIVHLLTCFELADAIGLFPDPEQAAARLTRLLAVAGLQP